MANHGDIIAMMESSFMTQRWAYNTDPHVGQEILLDAASIIRHDPSSSQKMEDTWVHGQFSIVHARNADGFQVSPSPT